MNGLLDTLNHLISAALAKQGGGSPLALRSVQADADGLKIIARIDHAACKGEVVLRLVAEPPDGQKQCLRLRVESWPETLPGGMEPFRALLEKARLHLELDFSE